MVWNSKKTPCLVKSLLFEVIWALQISEISVPVLRQLLKYGAIRILESTNLVKSCTCQKNCCFDHQGVVKDLILRHDIIDHTTSQRVRSGQNNNFQKLRQKQNHKKCRESPFVRSRQNATIHLSVNRSAAIINTQLRKVVRQNQTKSIHSAKRHKSKIYL